MLNLAECVCKVEIEYDNHGKRGIGVGQVNLYKIDAGKKAEFIEKLSVKFESLGEQDYQSTNDINVMYTVGTYGVSLKNEMH